MNDSITTGYETVQHKSQDAIETRKAYGIYISVKDAGGLQDWLKRFDDETEIVQVFVDLAGDVRTFTYEDFFERLGFDTASLKENAS